MRLLRWWMGRKWQPVEQETLRAYLMFNTLDGQRILQHLVDSVYCTVYEGSDPVELAYHNGRRSAVHDILTNLQAAENPSLREVKIEAEVERQP